MKSELPPHLKVKVTEYKWQVNIFKPPVGAAGFAVAAICISVVGPSAGIAMCAIILMCICYGIFDCRDKLIEIIVRMDPDYKPNEYDRRPGMTYVFLRDQEKHDVS